VNNNIVKIEDFCDATPYRLINLIHVPKDLSVFIFKIQAVLEMSPVDSSTLPGEGSTNLRKLR
jgi:dolichyl-phosphate-mannose--protein O-mannosyl transferase